jgi:hypothetical protein
MSTRFHSNKVALVTKHAHQRNNRWLFKGLTTRKLNERATDRSHRIKDLLTRHDALRRAVFEGIRCITPTTP